MDETMKHRTELPHYRFADEGEERRHELRERVAYYVPDSEPHDLVTSFAAHGELVQVRTETLVALLDRLDELKVQRNGAWAAATSESAAFNRGYEAGYRTGREDQRDGFDALGTDEEE